MSSIDVVSEFPVPEPNLTAEEMIARAVALRPLLRERQAETEEHTFYSEEVHQLFKDAGFYRAVQPRMFGGYEFTVDVYHRLVAEISRGCPSTGWCFALGASHVINVASFYDLEAQRQIFGQNDGHFVCASRGTTGTAEPTDGGWLVNGRWDYLSGSPYSTHIHIAVTFPDGHIGMAVIPADQYERLDDWRGMLGMKGSGSHSVVVENARIPEGWATRIFLGAVNAEETTGARLHNNPMYSTPVLTLLGSSLTSIALGTARAMLDEHHASMVKGKVSTQVVLDGKVQAPKANRAQTAEMQLIHGHALARLDCAEGILRHVGALFHEYARTDFEGGEPFGAQKDGRLTAMLCEANRILADTADDLMRTIGSSSARDGTNMQRYWRDFTVWRGHVSNTGWEAKMVENGAWALGQHGVEPVKGGVS